MEHPLPRTGVVFMTQTSWCSVVLLIGSLALLVSAVQESGLEKAWLCAQSG